MYNLKRLQAIREKLLKGDAEGAVCLAKHYAEEEVNRVDEVREATRKFMKGGLEAEDLREMCDKYEKKIIIDLLQEARKEDN